MNRAKIKIAGDLLTQAGEPTTYPVLVRIAAAIRALAPTHGPLDKRLAAYQRSKSELIR